MSLKRRTRDEEVRKSVRSIPATRAGAGIALALNGRVVRGVDPVEVVSHEQAVIDP